MSFVGRIRQFPTQGITLGDGCLFFPTIVHEIGHALGFFHEHSRADRDDYIIVHTQNIEPGFERAFEKLSEAEATTLGFGYDYASIMHYNPDTFANPNTDAISARQPNIHLGHAEELSPLDAAKANALYQCGKLEKMTRALVSGTK